MSRLTLALAGLVLLSACGGQTIEEPFFTRPPQVLLPSGARTDRNLVAVCYGSSTTTPEALRAMVAKACENPQMVRQDITGECTMLQPIRVTFACSRVDAEVVKVERPYRRDDEGGRFRTEPQVPGDASRELSR
jgi:hypothetical protein